MLLYGLLSNAAGQARADRKPEQMQPDEYGADPLQE
ncbi:hypothetical protein V1283_006906 [Bradyrhizobium sp. AZCC 2262]